MTRPWNRVVIDDDPGVSELHPDGRRTQGLKAVFCDDDVERMRTGYKCIACWENLDNAFPEACPLCSFPMRALQAARFAQTYKGHIPGVRSSADWDAAADRIEDARERRRFERRVAGSPIVVPRGIS